MTIWSYSVQIHFIHFSMAQSWNFIDIAITASLSGGVFANWREDLVAIAKNIHFFSALCVIFGSMCVLCAIFEGTIMKIAQKSVLRRPLSPDSFPNSWRTYLLEPKIYTENYESCIFRWYNYENDETTIIVITLQDSEKTWLP